ncbi:MAG: ribonuclease H-like domain-containing protein, partial [Bacteroidota bacterium]|nr:ribonuclease H-like domain-containing protein [Bacteroidota bacterium]
MLDDYKLENILFLDIETVPAYAGFEDVPEVFRKLWDKKSSNFRNDEESASDVYQRAGIYAEFGKVVCISCGIIVLRDQKKFFRLKSFYGDDEKQILLGFNGMLLKFASNRKVQLCAHNGKEFDFPFLARRMLVNQIALPEILDIAGKKPWEVNFLDTLELWKFGDYKHYTSLELLTNLFGIPSPKDDIDGSQVADVYY